MNGTKDDKPLATGAELCRNVKTCVLLVWASCCTYGQKRRSCARFGMWPKAPLSVAKRNTGGTGHEDGHGSSARVPSLTRNPNTPTSSTAPVPRRSWRTSGLLPSWVYNSMPRTIIACLWDFLPTSLLIAGLVSPLVVPRSRLTQVTLVVSTVTNYK